MIKDDLIKEYITLDSIEIGYKKRALMKPISLKINKGDFWGIVGPNGAGKTTLIKTIIGIIPSISGSLKFCNNITPKFGYVPQRHNLNANYPLTALNVVLMGKLAKPGMKIKPSIEDKKIVMNEISRLNMQNHCNRLYSSLSGGQQQRILIARALASKPDVLILDEPTSGMDLPGESDIINFLHKLHLNSKITIMMIGHHIGKVEKIVNQLCLINKDTGLFNAGPVNELLNENLLSGLYNRSVCISRHNGNVHVHLKDNCNG